MLYWLLKYVVLGPLFHVIYRPKVTGRNNIPKKGPLVIVGNHLSVIDSFFMPMYVPRTVNFLAKSDYFTGKGIKGWATRVFMNGTGQIPIDRSGGRASEASLNTGLSVLGNGGALALYPEGTRSPDGKLYRGRTGVARMILEANCVVVPAVMVGSHEMLPIGAKFPKRVPLEIRFGEPLDFSRFAGTDGDRFVLRSITDQIMVALHDLGEQEYVDVYASTAKAQLARDAAAPRIEAVQTVAAEAE